MYSATRFIALGAVFVAFTSAQGLGNLPSCATACVTQFTSGSNIGGCSGIDAKCICESKGFLSGIACCLASSCDEADQEAATTYAQGFCKISGVTDLPTAVSCTSTASSTASNVPSSTSDTTVIPATTNAPSSTSTSSTESSSASSSSTSSSSAAAQTTGAASHNVAGLGAGVFGGLAAAMALL